MADTLDSQFDASLLAAAKECFRLGYKPTEFMRMVHERGGLEAVRTLLHKSTPSPGFDRLWELKRLDLTVEAHILQPQWRELFTPAERQRARDRLAEYHYTAPWDTPEEPDDAADSAADDVAEPVGAIGADSPQPSDGMYGVKLIYPDHLGFPHLCDMFPAGNPRQALMNFRNAPGNVKRAASIPIGHRALVFTRQHIVWAIEFTGPIDDGSLLAAHGVKPTWPSAEWSVHRPIRFLARMNVDAETYTRAMHRHEIQAKSGVVRRSYGGGHFYISQDEYQRMFDVVPWDWRASDALPPAAAPRTIVPTTAPARTFILPPVPEAESLLALVRAIVGQPERNMEDLVKEFLLRLGLPRAAVRFQIGHIDVAVDGQNGKPLFVFEVKRSLLNPNARTDALRQGFDYANRTGARYVVISDADRYEIYDRKRGLDHATMLCGAFQLTAFRAEDAAILDIFRSRE